MNNCKIFPRHRATSLADSQGITRWRVCAIESTSLAWTRKKSHPFRLGQQKVINLTDNNEKKSSRDCTCHEGFPNKNKSILIVLSALFLPPSCADDPMDGLCTTWRQQSRPPFKAPPCKARTAFQVLTNDRTSGTKPQYKRDLTFHHVQSAQFIKISKDSMAHSTALTLIDIFPVVKCQSFSPRPSSSSL